MLHILLLVLAFAAPGQEPSQREKDLAAARAEFEKNPASADAAIWYGRRTAYLGKYREAIDIYTAAIATHPSDARLYRHRGHRYISVREFDKAVADFSRAAALVASRDDEIEPDGQPNARNIPTSTLKTNIYYHLGLAHYLQGNFAAAADAYRECMKHSKNADMQVATAHWLYMTLRRLDRPADAAKVLEPVAPGMEIIENASYYRLLLMYKGLEKPEALAEARRESLDAVTIGYGVANWYLYNGRRDDARRLLADVVKTYGSTQSAAFGFIAAEVELGRLK